MASYTPPQLRKEEALNVNSTTQFPRLSSEIRVSQKSTLAYASKAVEWEEKRRESEMNLRIEAEVAAIKAEKAEKRRDEDRAIMASLPPVRRAQVINERQETTTSEEFVSEWTTVAKKERKPRKFIYEPVERYSGVFEPEEE